MNDTTDTPGVTGDWAGFLARLADLAAALGYNDLVILDQDHLSSLIELGRRAEDALKATQAEEAWR